MGLNNIILLANESFSATMKTAGLNTIMGLLVVFFALTFIMFVIMLEGKIFTAIANKKAKPKAVEAPAAPAPVETETEDVSDDMELVAVLTAAIYAFEAEQGVEVPVDGLVVKSIRRRR